MAGRSNGNGGHDRSADVKGSVDRACIRTIVLDSSEDVIDVKGEEATGVEHRLDKAGDGSQRHVLCMGMSIPLRRSSDIARRSDNRENIPQDAA